MTRWKSLSMGLSISDETCPSPPGSTSRERPRNVGRWTPQTPVRSWHLTFLLTSREIARLSSQVRRTMGLVSIRSSQLSESPPLELFSLPTGTDLEMGPTSSGQWTRGRLGRTSGHSARSMMTLGRPPTRTTPTSTWTNSLTESSNSICTFSLPCS